MTAVRGRAGAEKQEPEGEGKQTDGRLRHECCPFILESRTWLEFAISPDSRSDIIHGM